MSIPINSKLGQVLAKQYAPEILSEHLEFMKASDSRKLQMIWNKLEYIEKLLEDKK